MATDTDVENLTTCGVCLCEYDEVDRKPKFLPCAHTFCLLCLKKICQKDLIKCPFCRETSVLKSNVESLPNNPYALHMPKFKENGKDTLKRKMEKSIELYDEKQCESMAISSEYEFRKKVKIAIRLFDENDRRIPTVPWLENGFRTGCEIQKAVSHAVFSLLKHQKIQLKREEPQFAMPTIPVNQFVLGESSIFIMKLLLSGSLKGEIRIRPLPTFHPEFLKQLGKFCYKFPKIFFTTVNKAHAGVFALFSVSHLLFRPVVSNFTSSHQWPGNPNASPGEVGIILNKSTRPGSTRNSSIITSLSFILSINPVNHQHKNLIPQVPAEIFGHVIYNSLNQPNEVIMELSKFKKSDFKKYTISIESH